MKLKLLSIVAVSLLSNHVFAVTECNEKIINYFIGTSHLDQAEAHLWVSFDGGGSASIGSKSAAFDGMLSTVLFSIAAEKTVKVRYLSDGVECKIHHSDWVGMWLLK